MNATITAGRTTTGSRAVLPPSGSHAPLATVAPVTARRLAAYNRGRERSVALAEARSATRHFVLVAATLAASGYAAYLALLAG